MEKAAALITVRVGRGKDIIIEVPLGTIAKDEETGEQEVEILEDGQEVIWMPGGKGGLGNSSFCHTPPTRRLNMHNQVCPVWKAGKYSS